MSKNDSAAEAAAAEHRCEADTVGPRDDSRRPTDAGFASVSYLIGTAISLLFFVVIVNLLVGWYATAVVRQALDDGARAGAVEDGTLESCQDAASSVLGDLLGGSWGSGIVIECSATEATVQARATGSLPGLIDVFGVLDIEIDETAVIIREPELERLIEENT